MLKEIECHDKFIEYLSDKFADNQIISKLPLLNTYPLRLSADIYDDDIEKINRWEIKTIGKMYEKLRKEHKPITPNVYHIFFSNEIVPYKEYFLDETYEKILPENIIKYWYYRINTDISWNEMYLHPENLAIDFISMLESNYLKIEKSMEEYNNLIGKTDC